MITEKYKSYTQSQRNSGRASTIFHLVSNCDWKRETQGFQIFPAEQHLNLCPDPSHVNGSRQHDLYTT
jgi:hypothetical protein